MIARNELSVSEEAMHALGLTADEAGLYLYLVKSGSATAKQVSLRLGIVTNSVYRLADRLEDIGFVTSLETSPKQFQAVPPGIAIRTRSKQQQAEIMSLSERAIDSLVTPNSANQTRLDVQVGKSANFKTYAKFARVTRQEILVLSVGEEVSESVWRSTKHAIDCGAEAKFIFQKQSLDNILLIKRWQAMGVEVRHLAEPGYHLNIFDSQQAIMSASNPDNSSERTNVIVYNTNIIAALRNHFYAQWGLALPVSRR